MARLFDDATNEYLQYGALITARPVTMACWFLTDTVAINQCLIGFGKTAEIFRYQKLTLISGDLQAAERGPIANVLATATDNPATGTWQHALGVFVDATDRRVYLNGGNKGTNATACSPDDLDRTNVSGYQFGGSVVDEFSGRLAEAAIWNATLSDAEAAILATGFSPLFVRPQNLVAYWPLIRDEDQDRVSGYDLTAYNTPSIAPHPPIIYPAPPIFYPPATGAPPAGLDIPVAMHHYMHKVFG